MTLSAKTGISDEMLDQLKTDPKNTAPFEELCDIYMAARPAQREAIRQFVFSNRDLLSALEHWMPGMREENPERYLQLQLASVSVRNGYPDYRDTLLFLVALWDFAEERGIAPQPLFSAAARISDDVDVHDAKGLIRQTMRPARRDQLRRGALKSWL
jgi:hypothetical protein